MRRKTTALYSFLVALNVVVWVWAFLAFRDYPLLLGTAGLAYTFGIRHAFDVDHIAAIDTVTRKLMHQRTCPVSVGFHFAIGHSAVMFIATLIVVATWAAANDLSSHEAVTGGVIDAIKLPTLSTFISATFLFVMAALNLMIATSTYRAILQVRRGGDYGERDLDALLNKRGFLSRLFLPLLRLINKPWQMAFVGFLFGLGFDTATEISLFGIAAAQAAKGLPVWSILIFPALFAAGMLLMDTTDSVLMSGAYGWAFRKPMRKLYYNLTITCLSALVALLISGIETLGLLAEKLDLQDSLSDMLAVFGRHWGEIGLFIVTLFLFSWFVSSVVYRIKRYDY